MPTRNKAGESSAVVSRKPQQERSLVRYNLLLDAANELLLTQDIAEIGLYQVADRAGVPAASAYHFFPSPGAVFTALAERYQIELASVMESARPPADGRWQTLLSEMAAVFVRCYNQNLPMSKVILGGAARQDLALFDERFIEALSMRLVVLCDALYHMPMIRDLQHRLHVMLTIVNGIWSLSFSRHGQITKEFEAEAAVAAIAYCRTFLPEFMEPKTFP
ncbi:AcrR family transcriptional regulator [Paracidovorax wautersii]|uniref:AcrR family transcriptional regulator n=1 Tax=Paracidovorax wautersii TaxID=1177982 RepID=A0ABU1IE02_9BURK|nr:AcrR family transcriptional regulator [Paracidovorax wautersii]